MTTKAAFTTKLAPEPYGIFMDDDQTAAQVDQEYDAYLRRKVKAARADIIAGRDFSNEEIEAESSAARDELL